MNAIDFEDYRQHYECKRCLEKEQVMDSCQEFLEEIVKQLYMTENLDKNKLENCLDELCFLLKVKMNTNDLNIQRCPSKKPAFSNWREFNKIYASSIN